MSTPVETETHTVRRIETAMEHLPQLGLPRDIQDQLRSMLANLRDRVVHGREQTVGDIYLHDLAHTVVEKTRHRAPRDIHAYFGLSYSNYLVVERGLLQSMPRDWQHRFVALLEEFTEAFRHVPRARTFSVQAACEREVAELSDAERAKAGVERVWEADGVDDGRWLYYDAAGCELEPDEEVLVPVTDPVPHYQRGRIYIAPAEPEEDA